MMKNFMWRAFGVGLVLLMTGLYGAGMYFNNPMMCNIGGFIGIILGLLDVILFLLVMTLPDDVLRGNAHGYPYFRYAIRTVFILLLAASGHITFAVFYTIATLLNVVAVNYLNSINN